MLRCWRCGRCGTRQLLESYRPGNYGRWECSNDRACKKTDVGGAPCNQRGGTPHLEESTGREF